MQAVAAVFGAAVLCVEVRTSEGWRVLQRFLSGIVKNCVAGLVDSSGARHGREVCARSRPHRTVQTMRSYSPVTGMCCKGSVSR